MIKKLLLLIVLVSALVMPFGVVTVSAQEAPAAPEQTAPTTNTSLFGGSKDAACGGAQSQDNPVACDPAANNGAVNTLIKTGLNLFSFLIAVVAVVMLIIGGFRFITSQGDSASLSNARNTIIYAIVGLVVVAMAQVTVRFVIDRLLKAQAPPPPTTSLRLVVKPLAVSNRDVV